MERIDRIGPPSAVLGDPDCNKGRCADGRKARSTNAQPIIVVFTLSATEVPSHSRAAEPLFTRRGTGSITSREFQLNLFADLSHKPHGASARESVI
jgi:hypothetical protein